MPRTDGRLAIQLAYDSKTKRTQLHVLEQRQPLKVVRAFHLDGDTALIHLHNLSGGVLAEDRLSFDIAVEDGARAQITSTSATRVYRSRTSAGAAECTTKVRLGMNSLLEYLPDPLIPFAGARYSQHVTIDTCDGAGLFWWETLAPGREARGELFAYDSLRIRFEIHARGIPIAIENAHLNPAARPLASIARLGPYRYLSTFYICRVGLSQETWVRLEKHLLELATGMCTPVITWGLSRLPAHGLVVRALSQSNRDIARGLMCFWRAAKQELYGQEPVVPRKIY